MQIFNIFSMCFILQITSLREFITSHIKNRIEICERIFITKATLRIYCCLVSYVPIFFIDLLTMTVCGSQKQMWFVNLLERYVRN